MPDGVGKALLALRDSRHCHPYRRGKPLNFKAPPKIRREGAAIFFRSRPLTHALDRRGRCNAAADFAITTEPPEKAVSQHQVSVRREAVHIRASRFELVKRCRLFYISEPNGRLPMKRLMILAFAAVTLFAAATAMLWSHSTKLSAGTAAMPSTQELHTVAGVNQLPNQEIEDQSLIFPSIAKR
jgi:hypothetical protein